MAFRTSYFNPTLYKKTLHRFWPLWAAYTVVWLFAIPLNLLNQYFDAKRWVTSIYDAQETMLDVCNSLLYALEGGVWISAGVGLVAAMAVFGYLYNNRSAAMMHLLPLRREDLFITQYLAGASMFLLPHLVSAGLGALSVVFFTSGDLTGKALTALLIWLLAQSGTGLFFFSFAVFCAMFTGHALALPVFYGILNCLVVAIYSLVSELMTLFFYGYVASYNYEGLVKYLTPVYALYEACQRHTIREEIPNTNGEFRIIEYCLDSPDTVAAYAFAGLVLAVLALMVYRQRHIESAGDVVSVAVVRPVFQIGVAFCAGLCIGTFTAAFFGWTRSGLLLTVCVLGWTVVGWFAAAMLLKKSFRVFRGGWKGCLAMLAAMTLLCAACAFDWFGIETKVPRASEVVSLSTDLPDSAPYDDGAWADLTLTDPEDIQMYIDLHHAVIREKDRALAIREGHGLSADDYSSVRFTYELSDGTRIQRRYNSVPVYREEVEEEGSVTWCFNRLLQDRSLVRQAYGMDQYADARPLSAWISPVYNPVSGSHFEAEIDSSHAGGASRDLDGLWAAVQADFDAGTLGRRWLFEDEHRWNETYESDLSLTFLVRNEDGREHTRHLTITLSPSAQNTLAWLTKHGVLGPESQLVPHEGVDMEKYPLEASVEVRSY